MSYAITNDYNNASYMAEIFSRRTQAQEANASQNFQQSTKSAQENASTNTQARANSTEYPRPSMKALIFAQEQEEAKVSETENNAQVEETEEKQWYMMGDPRAGEGNTYNYNKYPAVHLFSPEMVAMREASNLYHAKAKNDPTYNDAKFVADYGMQALESLRYGSKMIDEIQERGALVDKEFRLTLEEFGIEPTQENIFALTEDMELLNQIQDRLDERMAAHGIYPAPEYDVEVDHATQTVIARDKETGEIVSSDKFEYWNDARPASAVSETSTESETVSESDTTKSELGQAYSLGLSYSLSMDYLKSKESWALTSEFMALAEKHGVAEAEKMFREKYGYDFYQSGTPARYNMDFHTAVIERHDLVQSEIYKAMQDLGIEPNKANYDALYKDEELFKQVEARLAERMSALGIEATKSSGIPTITPETGDVSVNGKVVDKVIYA